MSDLVGNSKDRFSRDDAQIKGTRGLRKEELSRVGTSIVQPVNSNGKCRIMLARQILQKSLKWQILALMNKIELKHPKRFAFSMC